jgi:hypothetical protein
VRRPNAREPARLGNESRPAIARDQTGPPTANSDGSLLAHLMKMAPPEGSNSEARPLPEREDNGDALPRQASGRITAVYRLSTAKKMASSASGVSAG